MNSLERVDTGLSKNAEGSQITNYSLWRRFAVSFPMTTTKHALKMRFWNDWICQTTRILSVRLTFSKTRASRPRSSSWKLSMDWRFSKFYSNRKLLRRLKKIFNKVNKARRDRHLGDNNIIIKTSFRLMKKRKNQKNQLRNRNHILIKDSNWKQKLFSV